MNLLLKHLELQNRSPSYNLIVVSLPFLIFLHKLFTPTLQEMWKPG